MIASPPEAATDTLGDYFDMAVSAVKSCAQYMVGPSDIINHSDGPLLLLVDEGTGKRKKHYLLVLEPGQSSRAVLPEEMDADAIVKKTELRLTTKDGQPYYSLNGETQVLKVSNGYKVSVNAQNADGSFTETHIALGVSASTLSFAPRYADIYAFSSGSFEPEAKSLDISPQEVQRLDQAVPGNSLRLMAIEKANSVAKKSD